MNEIINALYQRKSVRVFTDDPITDEDKKLILTSAIQAPSAGCQLLYTILDITDQTKKDRLADLCDHQAFIAAGQMVLIFCADCQKWDAFYKEAGISPRCPGAGDLLLAVEDAMIAAQNAVVAAESLGIGSCYIGRHYGECRRNPDTAGTPGICLSGLYACIRTSHSAAAKPYETIPF